MNFFEAELTGSGDSMSLETTRFKIDLPPEKARLIKGYRQKRVIVGIRPEDLLEARDHVPGKTIPATVEVVEPIGSETYVNVNAEGIPLVAGLGRKTEVKPHQSIVLEPTVDFLHLFDIRDEKTIFLSAPLNG